MSEKNIIDNKKMGKTIRIKDFCDLHTINWFPILLKYTTTDQIVCDEKKVKKDLLQINHELYNNSKPKYTDLNNTELCKKRQKLIGKDIKFNAIWIDTTNIHQIDIDAPNTKYDKIFIKKLPFFKSVSKSYGKHYFIKPTKALSDLKNKYCMKKIDDNFSPINERDNEVEFLSGQGSYCAINAEVYNNEKKFTIDADFFEKFVYNIKPEIKNKTHINVLINKSSSIKKFWHFVNEFITKKTMNDYDKWFALMCIHKNLCGETDYDNFDNFCFKFDSYNYSQNTLMYNLLRSDGVGFGFKKLIEIINDEVSNNENLKTTFDELLLDYNDNDLDKVLQQSALNESHYDIAKYISLKYKGRYLAIDFIYETTESQKLYNFDAKYNYWKSITSYELLSKFSTDIFNDYIKLSKIYWNKVWDNNTDDDEKKRFQKMAEKIDKTALKLKNNSFKNSILKELKPLLSLNLTLEEINIPEYKKNINIIHFQNGYINLKEIRYIDDELFIELKQRTPNMYIFDVLPYDFIEEPDMKKVNEIKEIYKQIQPQEDQYKKLLTWLAYCLTGETNAEKAFISLGYNGSNGKSMITKIHKESLSIYTQKLNLKTFDDDYTSCHKVFHETITQGIRFAFLEEVSKKEQNNSRYKDFIDNNGSLSVEVLYKQKSLELTNYSKLLINGNHDPNFEKDGGMQRRFIPSYFKSTFVETKKDVDEENHKYLKNPDIIKKFNNDEYKCAYLYMLFPYLIKYYKSGLFIPESEKNLMEQIQKDNDPFTDLLESNYDYCESSFISKFDFQSTMKSVGQWKRINSCIRQNDRISYQRDKCIAGQKGQIKGIKLRNQIINDDENTIDEVDDC